jgi:hypothetical protein
MAALSISALNIVHLRPRPSPWQEVLADTQTAGPAPTRIDSGQDCFANLVDRIYFDAPHRSFSVTPAFRSR